MTDPHKLQFVLSEFSAMNESAFELSEGLWYEKSLKKGELFNDYKNY